MGDIQFKAQLVDEYTRLKRLKDAALRENAVETVKLIEEEMKYIKVKLQPMELPE